MLVYRLIDKQHSVSIAIDLKLPEQLTDALFCGLRNGADRFQLKHRRATLSEVMLIIWHLANFSLSMYSEMHITKMIKLK